MLVTKMVVRVLDAEGRLLGWTEVMAEARGDGCLWPVHPKHDVIAEAVGVPHAVSVHWADVNIEGRYVLPAGKYGEAVPGVHIPLTWEGQPMLWVAPMANGLPPVTVRSPVAVSVPVGSVGARTH